MNSLINLYQKYPKTYKLLNDFLNLNFGDVKIHTPYWMNKIAKNIRGPHSGKGTPGQLIRVTKLLAKKNNIQLDHLNKTELENILKINKIGVDCSGFVFAILNQMDKERRGDGIADNIFKKRKFTNWNPKWRANADILTSERITLKISAVKDMEIGDLIRMDGGKHVAVVVEKNDKYLIYAHSSRLKGVHLAKINIKNEKLGMDKQVWLEKTSKGDNLGKAKYNPLKGDSVRRFNWWK